CLYKVPGILLYNQRSTRKTHMPYAMVVYSSPRCNRGYLVLALTATVIAVLVVSRSLSITPTPEVDTHPSNPTFNGP
ncbi:unnamed protein product, partial [Urochloa humidicola]